MESLPKPMRSPRVGFVRCVEFICCEFWGRLMEGRDLDSMILVGPFQFGTFYDSVMICEGIKFNGRCYFLFFRALVDPCLIADNCCTRQPKLHEFCLPFLSCGAALRTCEVSLLFCVNGDLLSLLLGPGLDKLGQHISIHLP